ncbi:carbonic anhydrase [Oribacterium sp. WCC10]|uniref:carbonic anhydrase n=1 Tax=Oribacterium sp. WCC10 TaxID=1855343 RepID=UPI0008ED706B|nr:carbonic anhydrase [Oribacterium sp. WCC10]SFG68424.1 carbonic anhydrase [Oribacterium sp. WCC10]
MTDKITMSADKALKRLKEGNKRYMETGLSNGDVSPAIRLKTSGHGQEPFAVVVTCSDARVLPETIFSTGIGELFVIRVAGNVIDDHQLGSIEYAASHLGVKLIVIMGHTNCGAIGAAYHPDDDNKYIRFILHEIRSAIGNETDPEKACILNVKHSIEAVEESLEIQKEEHEHSLKVVGAVYHIDTGEVDFL